MRTLGFSILASAVLFAGCAKEIVNEVNEAQAVYTSQLVVSMPQTKTAFGAETEGTMPVVWSAGDKIAVVSANGTADKKVYEYTLQGEGGSAEGVFVYAGDEPAPEVITDVVYPVAAAEEGYVVPASQTYVEGSFDPAAGILGWHNEQGVGEGAVTLSNTTAVLCLQLTGNESVASVAVKLSPAEGEALTYTLTCGTPVVLTSTATPFYVVVPASSTEYNIEFTATSSYKATLVKAPSAAKTFGASDLVRYPALDFSYTGYAIGDYWPSEEAAEGLVFTVSDGGRHGKVISLYEKLGQWGPQISEAEAGVDGMRVEPEDGKRVTKAMIEKYKDSETFATDYPCFHWIYTELNKGDVDGPWYVPVRQEVAQWAAAMSGYDWDELTKTWVTSTGGPGYCQDKLPISGWTDQERKDARTAFNNKVIAKAGGSGINLYGKYCSTWENSSGTSVFRFNITTNSTDGGQYNVISKTDPSNRIRPIRTF